MMDISWANLFIVSAVTLSLDRLVFRFRNGISTLYKSRDGYASVCLSLICSVYLYNVLSSSAMYASILARFYKPFISMI